jgi:FtsZ-interacting cell division protein ZipA
MPELRWALFGLGALFIAGVALWEWRRGRRRLVAGAPEAATSATIAPPAGEDWQRRLEPHLDSLFTAREFAHSGEQPAVTDVPVIHPVEPIQVPVAREAAVDLPAAAHPGARQIRWPPERADRVLSLRLTNSQGALLQGRDVRLALEQAGLVPGPQTIYHRTDSQGAVLVSAANMMRPGDLAPLLLDEQQLRGLSLFSVLPGPLPAVRMLEELVAVARAVAWRLGATVQDERGEELDGARLVQLRQSLPDAGEGTS